MREYPPLSAADICRIIEMSAKSGVTSFKIEDIHFQFGPNPAPRADAPTPQMISASSSITGAAIPEPDHEKLTEAAIESENQAQTELLFDEMNLLAPYQAEQMYVKGEIKHVESDGTRSEE